MPENTIDIAIVDGNNKARIIAGYCWDWPTKTRNNTEFHDITIPEYNFGMRWNLNEGIWAIDPNSVNEAGCIHTSQGLEFEYVGIIIGPDLYFDGTNVCTDASKRAATDQSLKGIKKLAETDPELAEERADSIIRNTYRTLLTRDMKGCRVFCTNPALGDYIKGRMKDKYQMLMYPKSETSALKAAEDSATFKN